MSSHLSELHARRCLATISADGSLPTNRAPDQVDVGTERAEVAGRSLQWCTGNCGPAAPVTIVRSVGSVVTCTSKSIRRPPARATSSRITLASIPLPGDDPCDSCSTRTTPPRMSGCHRSLTTTKRSRSLAPGWNPPSATDPWRYAPTSPGPPTPARPSLSASPKPAIVRSAIPGSIPRSPSAPITKSSAAASNSSSARERPPNLRLRAESPGSARRRAIGSPCLR